MAADYQLTFKDYLSILQRRALLIVVASAVVFAAVVAAAIAIQPVYQSTGTILVESQQIPTTLVPVTVSTFADERIQVIRQRVMTRENLFGIVEKYRLFRDEKRSMSTTEMVDALRDHIGIELISADGGRRRGTTTIAFKLSFEHRTPRVAHQVANELVTLFLDENAKARTERATETTEFLTQEADKLKAELESLESQLASYKQQHGNSLPEHLELRMSMLQRAETDLANVEREYKSTQEELRFLDVELAAAKAGTGESVAATVALGPADELKKLREEYSRLTGTYTSTHPDVRALARRIEALEAEATQNPGSSSAPAPTATDLMVARVQAKIAAAEARLESLGAQEKATRGRIAQLETQIIQIPQVERSLTTLMRDHESAKKKYEEIRAKQVDAQIVESLEEDQKAERFSLLEPPLLPDKPVRPDRRKIILMGFVFAVGSSGGLAFLLEMLNQRVRGVNALTQLMRQPPLVVIPYITTRAEMRARKRRVRIALAAIVAAVLAALVMVHFLYQPLDILLLKIAARLG